MNMILNLTRADKMKLGGEKEVETIKRQDIQIYPIKASTQSKNNIASFRYQGNNIRQINI